MKQRILSFFLLALLLTGCGAEKREPAIQFPDGQYLIEVELSGGSGRATVLSPAALAITDGKAQLTLQWSSPFYDYMVVDGIRYDYLTNEGGSTFCFPVAALDGSLAVTADTVAMSTPHEIEYTLTLHGDTITPAT